SRRRHTRSKRDWSSDVCSSDLPPEMRLIRQLHTQFQTALGRLRSLEREHAVRVAFEQFMRRVPLPTVLLRWNLRLVYRNQAASEIGRASCRERVSSGAVGGGRR